MKRRDHQKGPWIPRFPKSKIRPVRLHEDGEAFTIVADRRIGIRIDDGTIEKPAVFWIDEEHVYCRVNWAHWFPVRVSEPGHFRMLKRSRQCTLRQLQSDAQDPRECQARVYRVAALPDNLFAPKGQEPDGGPDGLDGERMRNTTIRYLLNEIDEAGLDELMGVDHMELPGVPQLDLVVTSEGKNVLFAVYPPEMDSGSETAWDCEPEEDDSLYENIPFQKTVQRLVQQRKALRKFDRDAEVVLAIYDYPPVLERLRRFWQAELDAQGIELVSEMDFVSFLRKQFPAGEDDEP